MEEIVDSVSEVAAREDYEARPNWRIIPDNPNTSQDDDNATIVPEDEDERKPPSPAKDEPREKPSVCGDNWKLRERIDDENVVGVRYGKEERAVDVPDGASAVSAATTAKAGKINGYVYFHFFFFFARENRFD